MHQAPAVRLYKAYHMTFKVMMSYLWLGVKNKLFGDGRMRSVRELCHRRNARRIEKTISELKGLFIKVGQTLSIMTNFLPPALTEGLEGLQDDVPAHSYDEIEERFQQEFGKGPKEMFQDFEEAPIASASLGQVHRAKLADGTLVAVKVQYPEIDKVVAVDLRIMKRIFGLLHFFFPGYGMKEVYLEIADMVAQELDYQYEGKNLEEVKENFREDPDFLFPDVFWDHSTTKILTLRFMEGIKITEAKQLQAKGVDLRALAEMLIRGYCKQIFEDGVYHADPHPGNLMVQVRPDGSFKIILVDFGAIARINEKMKAGITLFAEGLIKKDTRILSNARRQMGFVAREDEEEAFDRLVEYFYSKLSSLKVENFKELNLQQFHNIEDLIELKKLNISFSDLMNSFHVPRDWVLLERTLLLALGLTSHLDPKLNPIEIILPYAETFVLKDKSLSDVVLGISKDVAMAYLMLPQEIQKALRLLNKGELAIKNPDVAAQSMRLVAVAQQAVYASIALVALGLGHYLHQSGSEILGRYHYYGAGTFSLIWLWAWVRGK
jgi:predicted unusual protein kinase regulating ubiquinone biosynthesis (AarF/ABC1/UbiB family)